MSDTFALFDTNVQFANLDTRLIHQIFPSVKPPRHGILNGRAQLAGGQHALDVNGDVTFDERRSGRSRVVAVGRVGFGPGTFNATNLRLTLRPVQMNLERTSRRPCRLRGHSPAPRHSMARPPHEWSPAPTSLMSIAARSLA